MLTLSNYCNKYCKNYINEKSNDNEISDDEISIEEFCGTLMQSVVEIWKAHLMTDRYSDHMALDEYYKEMPEKIDSFIESFLSINGKINDYKNTLEFNGNAIKYITELKSLVVDGRDKYASTTELESAIDDILSLIDSTLYKLKELK